MLIAAFLSQRPNDIKRLETDVTSKIRPAGKLCTSHNTMYHCKQLVISETFLITEGLNEVKCEP